MTAKPNPSTRLREAGRPFSHVAEAAAAKALLALAVAALSTFVVSPLGADAAIPRGEGRAIRKASAAAAHDHGPAPPLATLVQVHTDERVVLDDASPAGSRFDELLSDRSTGETKALDPRLLALLRQLTAKVPSVRIELVSGYRSAKLNERLRKKGRNVASSSQHSLGHAVDFRLFPEGADEPLEPAAVEKLVRELGWSGGVGIYPGKNDRFVHCDVGPNRRWLGK
ncbi:MAG: DUF882 domain-containing protein [Myxococcales bacterium]|nr:DUF882 domain-containing protein [Myxococcales bacterium]